MSPRIPFNVVIPREVVPGPVASRPRQPRLRLPRGSSSRGTPPPVRPLIALHGEPKAEASASSAACAPRRRRSSIRHRRLERRRDGFGSRSGTSRPVASKRAASADQIAAEPASKAAAAAAEPPKGSIVVPPVRGGCLSVGAEGNVAVRMADGTIRFFEPVHFERGLKLVPNPTFQPVPGISQAVAVVTSVRTRSPCSPTGRCARLG